MANDRHPVFVTIFDRSGRKKITAYDDSMWGWPNEESVTDYVMAYPAKKYPDHVVEVMPYSERSRGDLPLTAESLRWRFRTGRVAGQTSVRLLRKSRTAALHHATKKKSSAQLDREIAAFLQSRGHAPNMPHAIPDRGYMVAQHGGGTYLSSFGSKDEAVRFARGLAKQTREAYDIVKVQNRGEDRFIVDEVAPPAQVARRSHATMTETSRPKWYFWIRKKGMYGQSWKKHPSWFYHSSFTDKAALDRAIREHKKDKWSVRVTLDREGKTAAEKGSKS